MADELVDTVFTAASVLARVRFALINVTEASSIVIAAGTLATESIDEIDTYAAVCTGVRGTFVNIRLTVHSCEAGNALASVPVKVNSIGDYVSKNITTTIYNKHIFDKRV